MNCEIYQQQISRLLDNESNIQDFPDLEKHLQQCSLCTSAYNDFQNIDDEYQELSYPFPVPNISQKLAKHTMLSSSKRNAWMLVGAIILAFVFGVLSTIVFKKSENNIVYIVQPPNSQSINNIVEQLILYQQQQEWQKTKPLLKALIYENEDTQILSVAYFYLFEVHMKEGDFSQAIKVLRNFTKFTELNMMDQRRENLEYSDSIVFVKNALSLAELNMMDQRRENLDSIVFVKSALDLAKELQSLVKQPKDKEFVEEQVKNLELLYKGKIF